MKSATGTEVVTYDNFSGGERGTREDYEDIPNSFTATNMLVYQSGELGVRPGVVDETPASVPTGKILGYGTSAVPSADRWFIVGTGVYSFAGGGSNLRGPSGTALSATPTRPVQYVEIGTSLYFVVWDDKVYRLQPSAAAVPTVTRLTSSVGANTIATFGDRLMLGNINGSNSNRVRFSAALDYTTWDSTNFFDVGNDTQIGGMWKQRGNLIIGKPNGIFALSGIPGYNAYLREIVSSFWNGPTQQYGGVSTFGESLYFHGLGLTFPARFNGVLPEYFDWLDNGGWTSDEGGSPLQPPYGVVPLRNHDRGVVFLTQSNKAIAFINGVWTYHTFGVNITPFSSTQGVDNLVCMTDGGAVGVAAKFYAWNPVSYNHPGLASGSYTSPGDASTSTSVTGNVTFPEWWHKGGAEFRVKRVVIDVRKWNMGGSANNKLTATVDMYRRRASGISSSSSNDLLDEAQSSSSASGTLDRFDWEPSQTQLGNGFQLRLTNIKGLAIKRIQVFLEVQPFRGL